MNVPCAWIRNRQLNSGGGGGSLIEAPPDQVAAIWSNSQERYVGLAVWNPAAAERGIAFLGRNSLGWLPTNVSYTPGSGLSGDNVYQWFGGFPGGRLGSSAGNPNFISENSVQLYSMFQGVAPQQTQKTNEFKFQGIWHNDVAKDKLLLDRIKAVVFDAKALSDECTKAFQAAGATPIKDQLADQNIVFVTESIFMDSNEDDGWAPDKAFANGLREEANSTKRKYLGIFEMTGQIETSDITQKGIYKGKRYIGLTNWGLDQKTDYLSVTIIHALVHSGDIESQQQNGTHDLAYLGEKYDAIIEACQKNESKVKKAGRK